MSATKTEIQSAIDSLKILYEYALEEDKQDIKDNIEALTLTLNYLDDDVKETLSDEERAKKIVEEWISKGLVICEETISKNYPQMQAGDILKRIFNTKIRVDFLREDKFADFYLIKDGDIYVNIPQNINIYQLYHLIGEILFVIYPEIENEIECVPEKAVSPYGIGLKKPAREIFAEHFKLYYLNEDCYKKNITKVADENYIETLNKVILKYLGEDMDFALKKLKE